MSRIPAGLLYLAIYNPTLHSAVQTNHDDEDAEEQAQILFYTARERAVSRDRMLRQIGLAKALTNFAELLQSNDSCENVHAQSRRMIMVSPEPDYWIHACFELAKTPRPPTKAKAKAKKSDPVVSQDVSFDFHDSSIHDISLREHLLRGYEEFKLTHGSLAGILSTAGQQALELQLERFFTVWAWRWDVENDVDFASSLGVQIHPLTHLLSPELDKLESLLPEDTTVFALAAPFVIPSFKFSASKYPACLTHHILSRVLPVPLATPSDSPSTPIETVPPTDTLQTSEGFSATDGGTGTSNSSVGAGSMLAMPSVSLNMDVRTLKWGWPSYFAFGKGTTPKTSYSLPMPSAPTASPPLEQSDDATEEFHSHARQVAANEPLDVDAESLREAMSTEYAHSVSTQNTPPGTPPSAPDRMVRSDVLGTGSITIGCLQEHSTPGSNDIHEDVARIEPVVRVSGAVPGAQQAVSYFPSFTVHLPAATDNRRTQPRTIWTFSRDRLMLGLILDPECSYRQHELIEIVAETLASLVSIVEENVKKVDSTTGLPTVTTILQPQDHHVVSSNGFTSISSTGFKAGTEHLFYSRQMFQNDPDVSEIFSRGLHPQHWHMAKRGLGTDEDGRRADGEVFMQVARKESTLTDVDNELNAVVRKFIGSTSDGN
ncbi:uncharacterized protein FIBRA_02388 [Fibroporia radiculosa]|uniref:CCZ1/INTU/HSP4 first Longin domain-containing protein n=1 Tax=Fibroporia radiculosa TaxID=599839 RepID=J4G1N4_9APHY|nr:uncharacterized protein FIBRA_02388 [Fibroporia radiculosa]CCM00358.1 predicted protein [Fibroporia radiculosa]